MLPVTIPKTPKTHLRLAGYILLLLLLSGAGWQVGMHADKLATIWRMATTKTPERFTELYFSTPDALPTAMSVGKTYQLPFVISNHEANTADYSYELWYIENGQKHVISQHRVSVASNSAVTEQLDFGPAVADTTYQIGVTLLGQNQSIALRVAS